MSRVGNFQLKLFWKSGELTTKFIRKNWLCSNLRSKKMFTTADYYKVLQAPLFPVILSGMTNRPNSLLASYVVDF